jgi:hypothetical protein
MLCRRQDRRAERGSGTGLGVTFWGRGAVRAVLFNAAERSSQIRSRGGLSYRKILHQDVQGSRCSPERLVEGPKGTPREQR